MPCPYRVEWLYEPRLCEMSTQPQSLILNKTRLLKSITTTALERKPTPTVALTRPHPYSSLKYPITNKITHTLNNQMNIIHQQGIYELQYASKT
jgi:hypothetical protein